MQGGGDGRLRDRASVDYAALCQRVSRGRETKGKTVSIRTFGKEAAVVGLGIPPQEPAVAKVVIALNQHDAVAAGQAELVGRAGLEFVCITVSTWARAWCSSSTYARQATVRPGGCRRFATWKPFWKVERGQQAVRGGSRQEAQGSPWDVVNVEHYAARGKDGASAARDVAAVGGWLLGGAARRQRGAGSRWVGDCLRALTGASAVLWRCRGRLVWASWRLCLGRQRGIWAGRGGRGWC